MGVEDYRTIDGNITSHPSGYCTYHHGYLTDKQMRVHKCRRKHGGVCSRLKDMRGRYEVANMQSSLDKTVDRLIKIDTKLGQILQELKKISKVIDVKEEGRTLSDNIDREESI